MMTAIRFGGHDSVLVSPESPDLDGKLGISH